MSESLLPTYQFLQAFYESLGHFSREELQVVVMGVLTVFIPVVIAVLSPMIGKQIKGNDSKVLFFRAIINKVLFLPAIVSFSVLLLFLLSFDAGSLNNFYPLLVVAYIIFVLRISLKNLQSWLAGDVMSNRIEEIEIAELRKLTVKKDSVFLNKFYTSLWKSLAKDIGNRERPFLHIYIKHLKEAKENKSYDFIFQTLTAYKDDLSEREVFATAHWLMPELLEIEWQMFNDCHDREGKSKAVDGETDYRSKWREAYTSLKALVTEITELGVENEPYTFFSTYKEFINRFKQVDESSREFLKQNFGRVIKQVFETIPKSKQRYQVWESYPPEWLLTESEIRNDDNIIIQIVWLEFQNRLKIELNEKDDVSFNSEFDSLVSNLFPGLSIGQLGRFFTLIYSLTKNIEDVIENGNWSIGIIGKGISSGGTYDPNISEAERRKKSDEHFNAVSKSRDEKTIAFIASVYDNKDIKKRFYEIHAELKALAKKHKEDKTSKGRRIKASLNLSEQILKKLNSK